AILAAHIAAPPRPSFIDRRAPRPRRGQMEGPARPCWLLPGGSAPPPRREPPRAPAVRQGAAGPATAPPGQGAWAPDAGALAGAFAVGLATAVRSGGGRISRVRRRGADLKRQLRMKNQQRWRGALTGTPRRRFYGCDANIGLRQSLDLDSFFAKGREAGDEERAEEQARHEAERPERERR
ncbi:unnamed protein product, partial [Prorocentrum cordatum]